jgi:hypothetical protein
MPEITIEIDKSGKVNVSVEGAKGAKCVDITRFLEEALGEVAAREFTAEYFEEEVTETVSVGGGSESDDE